MSIFHDLTGQKFGRLNVIGLSGRKNRKSVWLCECECGNRINTYGYNLINGHSQSCGCLRIEKSYENGKRSAKHGKRQTRIYRIWQDMKARCYNSKMPNYHNYGEKGIFVCDEWKNNFQSFYEWSIKNGYAENLSIDRKDNSKSYSPDNCRWATAKEQSNNTSRTVLITYNGKTQSMKQWAEELNMNYGKLRTRIKKLNWSIEKSFSTP